MFRATHQEKATRQSWPDLQPLPAARSSLSLQQKFTPVEYERLCLGFVPQSMEDKWFIFLEGDFIYFHRSWTGVCIYQVRISHDGERYTAAEVYVNRSPDQYSDTDGSDDLRQLRFLINNLLLGKDYPFPTPANLPKNVPEGLYQHHVSGMGQREAGMPGQRKLSGWLRRWLAKR